MDRYDRYDIYISVSIFVCVYVLIGLITPPGSGQEGRGGVEVLCSCQI